MSATASLPDLIVYDLLIVKILKKYHEKIISMSTIIFF